MNYNNQIFKIELGKESSINADSLYSFGINSAKTAILLNYLIHIKRNSCSTNRFGDTKGGGLFIKSEAIPFVNELGEVGLYFEYRYAIANYLRTVNSKTEQLNAIKNKIADLLKTVFIRFNHDGILYVNFKFAQLTTSSYNNIQYISIPESEIYTEDDTKYITISKEEYRCLYEFLKNRNKEKTIKKYGETAYNVIIGKAIEDQFIISAIDVIKAEIENAEKEFVEARNVAYNVCEKQVRALRDQYANKEKDLRNIMNEKINQLKNQLTEMKNMSNVA